LIIDSLSFSFGYVGPQPDRQTAIHKMQDARAKMQE